jgi:hypothetical protein
MVEDILSAIADGKLKEGQRIASEAKLREQYGISLNSIRSGLNLLVERGVLRRRRGSGTFVASTEAATQRPLVQRDTIAIVRSWEYRRYHPFFSEQLSGITAGLARCGWKALDLVETIYGIGQAKKDVTHRSLKPQTLLNSLKQHPEIGGVICIQVNPGLAEATQEAGYDTICTAPEGSAPAIRYDWDAETERLFRIALERGAREICAVSAIPAKALTNHLHAASKSCGIRKNQVRLHHLACDGSHQGAAIIGDAFRQAQETFCNEVPFDGLIMTGDCEAQGVVDALLQCPEENWRNLPIVALLNKETRLQAQLPMTALMADGYAFGDKLAEEIHRQTQLGQRCPKRTILTCDLVEWD